MKMQPSRAEQNQIKAIIGNSYNKLYSQLNSNELNEVGNYKILKQIGEGSFGKVYLALHKPTHKKVVLKSSDKTDPNVVREIFYHRQFDFPYITKLYEVIITETKVWMVIEYCPNKELYDYLLSKKRISLDESARIFAQIVGAVYYAHSLSCVHRDLKLENILLDKDNNAKLTDFGFTRDFSKNTQLETICGTTVYMAPELLRREKYDGYKIDIWALGILLYTIINGTMPFDEDDPKKTELKIISASPDYDNKYFNDDSIDLVNRLLSKDPSMRPTIEQILMHPFLASYGQDIMRTSDNILQSQKLGVLYFHSKVEHLLLKKLKKSGFDRQAIKSSVQKRKCDSLSSLWFLLLEEEKYRAEQRNSKFTTRNFSVKKVVDAVQPVVQPVIQPTTAIIDSHGEYIGATLVATISAPGIALNKGREQLTNVRKATVECIIDSTPNKSTPSPQLTLNSQSPSRLVHSKDNFFKKVSKFFKNKKLNTDAESFISQKNSSNIHDSHSSIHDRNSNESKKDENDRTLRPTISSRNNHQALNMESKKQENGVAEGTFMVNNKKKVEEPRLKKFKSATSSEFSYNDSTGNYDSESTNHAIHVSNDGVKLQNLKISSNIPPRPVLLSNLSEISNDTFNSDYSTDGNSSSIKIADTTQSFFPQGNGGLSQSSLAADKSIIHINKKIIRRELSFISSASSTSELSSRADSFYDLATASLPKAKESRKALRSSNKEMNSANFEAPRFWSPNSSYHRRNNMRRRSQKRGILQGTVNDTQPIIQEESSSVNDDYIQDVQSLPNSERLEMDGDDQESVTHSENFRPLVMKTSIKKEKSDKSDFDVRKTTQRSFSPDSNWSRTYSDLSDDLKPNKIMGTDEPLENGKPHIIDNESDDGDEESVQLSVNSDNFSD
ncbi:hypothetical protein Kpol_1072p19 [Vanderwaltozyma polyspora DSM 70294]|uniref:non-specific serine/threonine protein kinase n=1 Tax=Vanderwaltozyma polyspora (strain ATCC 22028 / DSM 70294 / BCRC 21397 / CBS 2163 / NBRC 10782 / NRRL Y-8283 / UCD 57-17) TaxID=436907 RepID=A7TKN7_VANPO|nr:uncharacterized protein Kpol_1072p19 [Vanderwaltozyma polyspora DSM 70294]EDO17149.1 hypothetical protein Kpol_1072p19 [Vanderwaltozyma polyspora DSM 70294]